MGGAWKHQQPTKQKHQTIVRGIFGEKRSFLSDKRLHGR